MKAPNPGLEGIIVAETNISLVDGDQGKLVFRGHWAEILAAQCSFEEVAHLLWYGNLPSEAERVQLCEKLAKARTLPPSIIEMLESIPMETPLMNVLAAVAAVSNLEDHPLTTTSPEQAILLAARIPSVIAYRYRQKHQLAPISSEGKYDSHTAYYLNALFGKSPAPEAIRALEGYLILAMEHGFNASTFAARVVASTESDMCSAVAAAIGAMKGPLHGGAPTEVIRLLNEIGSKENAEAVLREKLDRGEKIMGFGHRIYRTHDPRAQALREICMKLSNDPWLELALHVEETAVRLLAEYKPGRSLYTNVEFYAAAVMKSIAMPSELFTPTFTMARIIGWTAHILEQADHNRIVRPQSRYIGPMPQ